MPIRPPLVWPLLALTAFVSLLCLVAGDWAPVQRADLAVSDAFRDYGEASPDTVAGVRVVTDVMGTLSFLAIGVTATVLLAARRRPRAAGFCAAVTAVVPVLWGVMHAVLHRPRPLDGFVEIDSNGFPSGHTTQAAATALTAVLLLWPGLGRRGRLTAVLAGAAFALAIGLTRVALLAHWPSDVLGGWLLALAVVPLLAAAFAGRRARPPAAAAARSEGVRP